MRPCCVRSRCRPSMRSRWPRIWARRFFSRGRALHSMRGSSSSSCAKSRSRRNACARWPHACWRWRCRTARACCSTATSTPRASSAAREFTGARRDCPRRARVRKTCCARRRRTTRPSSRKRRSSASTSPCWDRCIATPSHPDARPLGWQRFAELVAGSPLPVYALGGLTAADLDAAIAHGAHGLALRRAAWPSTPGGSAN